MMKLVECIPNFSVSRERDEAAFNALVETAQAVAGCTVLDVQSDGTHNRCVFTLVGSPEGIGEAAFRLAKRAMEVIDMTKHQGAHPRMGATDVIPFVPTMDMTVEECVELSRQVAQRIWEELGIPSFLYEESATAPGRVNLAKIRKGQFEGMPEKLLEPEWAPDFGQRKIHPTAGIIAIGARMPLVAFNVNLDGAVRPQGPGALDCQDIHTAGHQLVHFLHGDSDVHGGAGVILFDDADDRQVHHLLDLGDVAHGVGTDAHGTAHGGSLGHQGHHAALLGVQRFGLQCLTRDDQTALDLSKQFFLIHCFSPPF